MKKLHIYFIILVFSAAIFPTTIAASEKNSTVIAASIEEVPDHIKVMINRLHEIKQMDKSALTRLEKKQLRKEVKAIKSNLENPEKNVFASIGGVLIVILVLVLVI